MRVLRSTNRVVLLVAFLVCIGAGFTLALRIALAAEELP